MPLSLSPVARVIALVALSILLVLMLIASVASGPSLDERAHALLDTLHDEAARRVDRDRLAREDGYAYTVDVAQLALFAARSNDAALYLALADRMLETVVVDDPQDTYTRGFVAWRHHPDQPLDASGTTEALRVAQALYEAPGLERQAEHRPVIERILAGYARHAATDQGMWFVRNYYNLQTNAFSPNSYLVDYDPDFVAAFASAAGDPELVDLAERSNDLIRDAATPAGLIHAVVMPELATLMPGDTPIFSPNRIEGLGNVATVAIGTVETDPATADRVLDFAVDRLHDLGRHYDATTGRRIADSPDAHLVEHAVLLRLAAARDHPDTDRLLARLVRQLERDAPVGNKASLYTLTECLLALQSALSR
ncbi:MAG: hypothetical protein AAF078_02585 [Planctomycetota bacterium]